MRLPFVVVSDAAVVAVVAVVSFEGTVVGVVDVVVDVVVFVGVDVVVSKDNIVYYSILIPLKLSGSEIRNKKQFPRHFFLTIQKILNTEYFVNKQ